MSQRRAFTFMMSLFATTFCVAITGQVLGGQADLLTDIMKTAVIVALSTAVMSYAAWTLTHFKQDSVSRGAVAGFLTAVTIIPIPAFLWHMRTLTLEAYGSSSDSIIAAIFSAITPAIKAGLYTFVDITKASLIAVIASMILGAVIAYFIAPKSAKA